MEYQSDQKNGDVAIEAYQLLRTREPWSRPPYGRIGCQHTCGQVLREALDPTKVQNQGFRKLIKEEMTHIRISVKNQKLQVLIGYEGT